MSDLAWLVAGSVGPAALGYLVICWKDYCSRQVDVTDDLGLCAYHRDELRRDVPTGSS